jgi:DNA repair exonuclease SbcCD ATPase subunit
MACSEAGLGDLDDCEREAEDCQGGLNAETTTSSSPLEVLGFGLLEAFGAGGAPLTPNFSKSQCLSVTEYDSLKRDLESRIRDLERDITRAEEDIVKEQERANKEKADLEKQIERTKIELQKEEKELSDQVKREQIDHLDNLNKFNQRIRDAHQAALQAQGQLALIMLRRNSLMGDIAQALDRSKCLEETRKILQSLKVSVSASANSTIRSNKAKKEEVQRAAALCTAQVRQARDVSLQEANSQIQSLEAQIQAKQAEIKDIERSMNLAIESHQDNINQKQKQLTQAQQLAQERIEKIQRQMGELIQTGQQRIANLQTRLQKLNAQRTRASNELAALGARPNRTGSADPRKALGAIRSWREASESVPGNCPDVRGRWQRSSGATR